MFAGCQMVIAPGAPLYPVRALAAGGRCTWFIPQDTPGKARKHWIGGSLQAKGCVHIDAGALTALQTGKSLLPVGVTHITGQFDRGDAVDIIAPDGHSLGKGLIAHRSDIAIQLIGLQSDAVHTLLGYQGRDELIHRDNMALDDPIRIPS
jgi:glutamate 5-kinase